MTSRERLELIQESFEFKTKLKEKYKNLPQKCIADEIWLYCRYLYDDIENMISLTSTRWKPPGSFKITKEKKEEFYIKLQELYQEIRGEIFYQGWKTASVAGGIFYITGMLCGVNIVQPTICEKLHISGASLRNTYTKLIKYYKRNEKKWPY